MNAGPPYLSQAAVADFIAQGHFARHLKRLCALCAERRGLFAQALVKAFGHRASIEPPLGGTDLVILFNADANGPVDDLAIAARARGAGLAVSGLSPWYLGARMTDKHR